MARKAFTIEQVLSLLAETPEHIAALTSELTSAQLRARPAEDEWSANEVLAHLRSCADMWGKCIATILAEDHPTIQAVNPKAWIKQTDYPDLEFQISLDAFTRQRADLLTVLEPLPHEAWSRAATIMGAGSPLERTLHSFAERLARHERPHIKQIARAVDTLRV
jgi:hypothetical protein